MACTSYRKEREAPAISRSRDPSGRPAVPQPIGRPQQETPAMPSDFHVFGVFALRGTVTRPDAFRPSARICEHLAGIVCCPLSFRNLRTPRRCRHGSAADCPEGERRPRLPQPVGLTGERLPPKSSACAPQSAPFAMNCRGCTVTALKRLPASVSVCACSAGFRPAVPAVRRESPGAKPSAVRIA